jgi:hypothetical protein
VISVPQKRRNRVFIIMPSGCDEYDRAMQQDRVNFPE